MRNLMLGIIAVLVGGCVLGEDKSSGPKVIGYARTYETFSTMPACSADVAGIGSEMTKKIRSEYALSAVPGEKATFCVYLTASVGAESRVYKGLKTQGTPILDQGDQCLTVEQPKTDTITTENGNQVVVDVIQDPCVPFLYGKDLKKE